MSVDEVIQPHSISHSVSIASLMGLHIVVPYWFQSSSHVALVISNFFIGLFLFYIIRLLFVIPVEEMSGLWK